MKTETITTGDVLKKVSEFCLNETIEIVSISYAYNKFNETHVANINYYE